MNHSKRINYRHLTLKELVSDQDLEKAFKGTNFGSSSDRDVVRFALLKKQAGFWNGHTAHCILKELGLITEKGNITVKGKCYLYEAFCEKGKSF